MSEVQGAPDISCQPTGSARIASISPRPNPADPPDRAPHVSRADDVDLTISRPQSSKRTRNDADDVLVEFVQHVLRSAVASVASTVGNPHCADRRISDAKRDARIVHGPELAASDDQREHACDAGHDPIRAGYHRPRRHPPLDLCTGVHHGESRLMQRHEPRIGAGAHDPPLGRIGRPRVLLVAHQRSIGVRVRPPRQPTPGHRERCVDPGDQLMLRDHLTIIAAHGASARRVPTRPKWNAGLTPKRPQWPVGDARDRSGWRTRLTGPAGVVGGVRWHAAKRAAVRPVDR